MSRYVGTDVKGVVGKIKKEMDAEGKTLRAVYFVACGGSEASLYTGQYIVDCESEGLSCKRYNSNVFVHAAPKKLDGECIVVLCSMRGTAETIEALRVAKAAGAHPIVLTGAPDTSIAAECDSVIVYGTTETGVYDKSVVTFTLRVAVEILHQFEGWKGYDKAVDGFGVLNEVTTAALVSYKEDAVMFADKCMDDEVFYTLGCGPLFGTAYTLNFCYILEMQTRHAVFVPSGDYFHGPFETTTSDLAVIVFKSGGRTRPMDERAERFLSKHGGHHTVIDIKSSALWDRIDGSVAEYFESVMMYDVIRMYAQTLADRRAHPLTDRVYMWKIAY